MIIYKTTNLLTGKIYVGKDCSGNPGYLGSGVWIKRAVRKYGKNVFRKDTLEVCDASNICEREIYWIKKLDARNPKVGYNIAVGGDGGQLGAKVSEKTRRKHRMQKHLRGKDHPNFGKPMPEATRRKEIISHLGSSNHFFGKHHTKKTKLKISRAKIGIAAGMLGKTHSKTAIRKMQKSHTGKRFSEEHKRKISKSVSAALRKNIK
jgi:group I intron endonuclease